jgi:O-antigen/teichoic acid export membrane protein
MLKRNIVANVFGGSWVAIMSLILIPVQVKVLGVEAYGLVAFLASLQILFSIFDFGLSPTITREVARDTTPARRRTYELLQSLSWVYWSVGLGLGAVLLLSSPWIASHWLHLGALPSGRATSAIRLAALAVMLRWPVSFYSGVVAGLQRFDVLNGLRAVIATIGILGGIAVLLVSRDLIWYMSWTVAAAAIELTGYLAVVTKLLPGLSIRPIASGRVFRAVVSFAAGVNLITLLSMVLTQSDRLLLSKLLPVEVLGYYALAYNIVYGLTLIPYFVTSATFPAFVASHAIDASDEFRVRYGKATQVLMYAYNLPAWLLVFFGYDILTLLTSRSAAGRAAPILAILALGFLFNAAAAVAYSASVATGNTRIPIVVNAVAVVIYLPLLLGLTLRWGGIGAALAWLFLNFCYLPTLVPLVHRRIIGMKTARWLLGTFLPFVLLGLVCFGSVRIMLALSGFTSVIAVVTAGFLATAIYVLAGFGFLQTSLRAEIARSVADVRQSWGAHVSGRG